MKSAFAKGNLQAGSRYKVINKSVGPTEKILNDNTSFKKFYKPANEITVIQLGIIR